jgi:hypothetical protein
MDEYHDTVRHIGTGKDIDAFIDHFLHTRGFFVVDQLEYTLDNPILPLFGFDRWKGLSKLTYARMKPAFQLATIWLTDDQFADWWYHHLVGVPRWREDIDGEEVPVLLPSKEFDFRHNHYDSKVVRQMWLEKLRQLGEVMQWPIYE